VASSPDPSAAPTFEKLRSSLIPTTPRQRWDDGELPRAVLHLDDHGVLEGCALLLELVCVQRRCHQDTPAARALALHEILRELLSDTPDHRYCAVLRVLAGLQPENAGPGRDERQRLAGDWLGPPGYPAAPRTVRRRVKAECWPWLLDRLAELETRERRACNATTATPHSTATPQLHVAGVDLGMGLWANASPEADAATLWLPVAMHGGLVLMPVRIPRRTMLKAGGAALLAPIAGLLDHGDHEHVASVVSGHSRPDIDSVEHFEALLAHFRKLDDLMGPRCIHGAVQSTIGVLDGLCDAADPRVRPALLSICAQYEQLDAWMWLDRGQPALARSRYDRALARATESGNQPFAGYLLAFRANQALEEENPGTTIALASEVRSGRWRLTPAVEAYAAQLEARAWAISGEADRCERNLDDVAQLLAASSQRKGDEPPWIYFYGEERLPVHRGFCYARLGRTEAAISVFDEAIANLPRAYVRDRANYLFWSAKAYADNNDPKQAATVARDAVQTLIDAGSDSVLDEARKLHARLAHAQSVPEVREFGELLQTAGNQVST
jgi:tetratricopeptide (TPR) repeat protein